MRDFTMKGIHLCTVRLNLLPLNTMGPLDIRILEDVGRLRSVSSKDLRALGRLPYPMLQDRKSTRLNSSHSQISYAVFCLKKKKRTNTTSHLRSRRAECRCSRLPV